MGTTAQKLEYLGTTKSQLKNMINYGLDDNNKITSSTTFRNYVTSVKDAFLEALRTPDTLFTNLPKKSGTGANITLNDTANAPMRIELGATELSQSATPTPSSPQDIHTISGSNKVVVNGKNLFGNLTNGYYDADGNYQTTNTRWCTPKIQKGNNTKLYFYKNTSSYYFGLVEFDSNNTLLNRQLYITSDVNITFNNNTKTFAVFLFDVYSIDNLELEISFSPITTYEPYTSQEADIDLGDIEYCKIGNYEDKFIRNSGKNLFDESTMQVNKNINTEGVIGNYDGCCASEQYIEVEPNTTYTFSCSISPMQLRVNKYTSNKTNIERIFGASTNTFTFTTDSNCYYVRLSMYSSNSALSSNYLDTIQFMLNEGTTALPYEPYGSNEWYIKKNIGKVVLDGTEDWSAGTSGVYYRFNTEITDLYYVDDRGINVKSNYFNASITDNYGIIYTWRNRIFLYPSDTTITTDTALKTWLSLHNTEVYYILATPTYTQITGTLAEQLEYVYQKMLSQKGVTNISQINNDLSFNLNVLAIEE